MKSASTTKRPALFAAGLVITYALGGAACTAEEPDDDIAEGSSSGAGEEADGADAFFTAEERSTILAWLGTLPATAPPDPTNRFADDAAAAALGQRLFFDTRVSAEDTVSCATCHEPAVAFSDSRANTSEGIAFTARSSISILNGAYGAAGEEAQIWQFWDGRRDSQWSQALGPVEDPTEMAGSRSAVALLIYDSYRDDYEAVFGAIPTLRAADDTPVVAPGTMPGDGVWEALSDQDRDAVNAVYVNFGKAIGAYERLLLSRNSRFDQFWEALASGETDSDALTQLEKEGLRVFIDKGRCLGCHSGPNFTDGQFHNIAVAQAGDNVPATDMGRALGLEQLREDEFNCASPWSDHPNKAECSVAKLSGAAGEVGAFKTPSLRSVTLTPPYMHTGHLGTLEQVIAHYDLGGAPDSTFDGIRDELMRPLGLDLPERQALVAFLGALEGDPVDPSLTSAP